MLKKELFQIVSSLIVLITAGVGATWLITELVWATINQWSRMAEAGKEFVQWLWRRKAFSKWLVRHEAERNTSQTSLEDYLLACLNLKVVDHSLRAMVDCKNNVTFYIHPQGVDGQTLDFLVECDDLTPLQMKCKCGLIFLARSPEHIPDHKCTPLT